MAEQRKQERDFTKEVDELLPETRSLAQAGKLQEALDKLFAFEKQTRNASDAASTIRLVKEISQLCYDARNYALLNSSINTLSKKHGQLKASTQAMVELAMGWLDEIRTREGDEKWLELIETLRTVTEGKIFLETPRARVTLKLTHYYELLAKSVQDSATRREHMQKATDLISELQVETYSSMERREKTEFILEQMRMLIALAQVKDTEDGVSEKKGTMGGGEAEWVKVRVASRKVNESFLKEEANEVRHPQHRIKCGSTNSSKQDLKMKFYEMMIQYALKHDAYLDVAKYYHTVWETPAVKADEKTRGPQALEHIAYYIVLAPHDNEQSDMLHRIFRYPELEKMALHFELLKSFTTPELMRWPGVEAMYGPHLRPNTIFKEDKFWEDLHTRVIEHNIRIVSQYYTRITLARLTQLLDLTQQKAEETLCRLVVSGTVWAKIDRPTGTVNFRKSKSAEDVMNDWSSDMQRLLSIVEKTWMGVNAAQAAQARAVKA
ncbi:PCI domain-containing protein [Fomitopsis serialis]|uniref:PCI domain-containing protein n=1 Tax=Fomitopsis serialis TaxID=139415 RepID=UPI0020089FE5|nr:PCI domain-containing protein [Neoantrodia serialis]KAH9937230.1 PCI domain-containing protein [Neoantrodia serialis]